MSLYGLVAQLVERPLQWEVIGAVPIQFTNFSNNMYLNKNISVFNLEDVFVVYTGQSNAEETVLYEAIISSVTLHQNGANPTFKFLLANGEEVNARDIAIYASQEDFTYDIPVSQDRCTVVLDFLKKLGVPDYVMSIVKNNNGSPSIAPIGYFINDNKQVEAVSFPIDWEFIRDYTVTTEDNEVYIDYTNDFTHKANFINYDSNDIYTSQNEALSQGTVSIVKIQKKHDCGDSSRISEV